MIKFAKSHFIVIALLSISSGLPLTLSASTLVMMLVDYGIDIKKITVFGLASTPYAFKYLWAPLIDTLRIPFLTFLLGRRRAWLILTKSILFLTIILTGIYASNDPNLLILGLAALCLAFFSATQDIIIDAYRIELLSIDDQAMGAAIATFGYRIGMLISSAGCMILSEYFGWSVAYFIIALMLIPGAIAALLYKEPDISSNIQQKFTSLSEWLMHSFYIPFAEFFNIKSWFLSVLFILSYKLSDAFIGILTAPFLMDIGFSKIEIASILKIYGFIAVTAGMFAAGYMISRKHNLNRALLIGLIIQCISNLAFLIQSHYGCDATILIAVISIENFCGGVSNAALVAYISTIVKKEFSATHYAILSSLAVFGRTTISTISGTVADAIGWTNFFTLSTLLSLPALICLYYLGRKNTK